MTVHVDIYNISSQGSNKREAEDATPWSVMVQQVRAAAGGGVEDEEEDFMVEEPESGAKKGKEAMEMGSDDEDSGVDDNEDIDLNVDTSLLDQSDSEDEEMPDILQVSGVEVGMKRPAPALVTADEPKKKKRKKSQKCKVCGEKGHWKKDCEQLPEERRKELQELNTMKIERKGKGTGRKKSKIKLADILSENKEPSDADTNTSGENEMKSNKNKKQKNKFNKNNKDQPVKDRSGANIEEGEALFQGFRVTKEDQERLKKLQKQLKSSGATKEEVDFALKRERRKAEKTLARSKKLVCFNCREPGHMLADCPHTEAVKVEAMPTAAGHCFKCGSLEHTSKDCKSKLKRENAYRFAVCFICKQEGHLAKACPDNPKGLYPNGGGCVFCGSVEHLKRDCPRKAEKDLRQGVKVGMMDGAGLEEEDSHVSVFRKKKSKTAMNKPKKVVAF